MFQRWYYIHTHLKDQKLRAKKEVNFSKLLEQMTIDEVDLQMMLNGRKLSFIFMFVSFREMFQVFYY